MKIGLFFGSFNPIHTGHMIIANVMKELGGLDKIWFIVSPQNPFKKNNNLLPEQDRLDLVREAINDDFNFQSSDIEFSMPKPSYTVDTLIRLTEKHPTYHFDLIVGEDNLKNFHKWKNFNYILENHRLLTYPRPNSSEIPDNIRNHKSIVITEAPMIDISATLIRKMISNGQSIKYLVPKGVAEIIDSRGYYSY